MVAGSLPRLIFRRLSMYVGWRLLNIAILTMGVRISAVLMFQFNSLSWLPFLYCSLYVCPVLEVDGEGSCSVHISMRECI